MACQITERDVEIFHDLYRHQRLDTNHIAALHCWSEEHKQRLRRRLQVLFQNNFLYRLRTPIDVPKNYMLGQRGMNALAAARAVATRRVGTPKSGRQYREHDLELSDFTVTLDLLVRDLAHARLIDELELMNRATLPEVKKHRGWPVSIRHAGETRDLWVKPDRLLGIQFADRPTGRDTRYYAIELDRGSMPVEASSIDRASILRKLLAYQATIEDGILTQHFAIPHCYVLFVTGSATRRDNMIRLAQELVRGRSVAETMLFTTKPKKPSVGFYDDLRALRWINGRGKEVELVL